MKKKANSYTPIGYSYFIHAPRLLRSSPPSPFTQPEAESTATFIQPLINPKGDQGDDAE